ncbi:AfsR/SARP family transcriptional regulator [Mangrovihabitans endophyticus]|uniref:SARP family transcriptional regulator n=1 Tax=Mangrovihabitans endophyticus TaxID=1751298 RepID=A0A8J3BX89_9ACTN|nr:BTAD domain-containing putative transcriptional regulator [Mangrovihabitans endophyticus]GGK77914.1 SARP family transcriptional regulator [Mangrovihabitans endophyticus]
MSGHGDATAGLRVTLLGAFGVCRGDEPVPVPGARLRGLIVRLALAGGRAVDAGALADALWPEERPADPANALQSLVSRLRRILGSAGAVAQVEGGYRLGVTEDDVDAVRFERLLATGRERLRTGAHGEAAELLGEAVDLWDGPAGAEPPAVAAVAPAAAVRLARSRVEADTDLAEAELALGRPDAAAARLTALLAEQPLHERAAALLMDALAAQGRQAEALALYGRVRESLADTLGVDPGAALRERHVRLLRGPGTAAQVPALAKPPTTAAVAARAAAPTIAGGPAGAEPPPSNLPASLTSFVGRDDDLARIGTMLATGRLVTVLGPGGAGKTRLALEAGRRHRHEYRHGTWLIDLSSVTEPAKVGAALLAAIGLRGSALFESAKLRADAGGELDVLADQLGGRECLFVVDNCEHLIDAVAHLLSALLARCAGLRVLATSREALAIDGEALVPLGPLTLPEPDADVEQARRAASVRLFSERAAAVRPGFDVDEDTLGEVLRIVRGLDGMPLALELAAARLRTLSLAELAAGLSDRFRVLTTGNRTAFPRHRTLRAVIAWSWDLLEADARTVAERISVLPGGVTPASAVAVCAGTAVPGIEIPELLAGLVDRSLVQLAPESGRYRMLETIREYGQERLAEQGVLSAVRDRAARHVAELIARHEALLRGAGQLDALAVLHAEYDNALAALRHFCDCGDADGAVALALDLSWYWQMFGRHNDATYWLGEAIAVPAGRPGVLRDIAEGVLTLNRIATTHARPGDGAPGQRTQLRALADRLLGHPELPGFGGALAAITLAFLGEAEASLTILQRLIDGSDVWLAGLARLFRSQFAENEGRLDQVRSDVSAALDCFAAAGDRWGLATALPMRALLRQYDGDLDGAVADLTEAKRLARDFGSLSLSDEIFIDLRWIDLQVRLGEDGQATEMMGVIRERVLRSASPEMTVLVDALEAGLWVQIGDLERARELVESAAAGMPGTVPFGDQGRALIDSVRGAICVERGDSPGAHQALARAYAAAVESKDMPILAMVSVTVARLAALHGRFRDTAVLLGAAARLRGAHDHTDRQICGLSRSGRAALGDDGFARAYEAGWELDVPAALTRTDPARLRAAALPAGDSAADPGDPAQARRP